MHFSSVIGSAGSGTGTSFTPTITGDYYERSINAGTVWAFGTDYSGMQSDISIWLVSSASDIEVKVQGDENGLPSNRDVGWADELGNIYSGEPDNNKTPGSVVFSLGIRSGVTVQIYTTQDQTDGNNPGTRWVKVGSFTDDGSEGSFFNPVDSTNYGYDLFANVSVVSTQYGATNRLRFKFRKSGYNDYTITFVGEVEAEYLQKDTGK
jgi:hypothetical protein